MNIEHRRLKGLIDVGVCFGLSSCAAVAVYAVSFLNIYGRNTYNSEARLHGAGFGGRSNRAF